MSKITGVELRVSFKDSMDEDLIEFLKLGNDIGELGLLPPKFLKYEKLLNIDFTTTDGIEYYLFTKGACDKYHLTAKLNSSAGANLTAFIKLIAKDVKNSIGDGHCYVFSERNTKGSDIDFKQVLLCEDWELLTLVQRELQC